MIFEASFVVGVPENAIPWRADEDEGEDENEAANRTRLPLDEKGEKVENQEHGMIVQQRGINRFRNQ